MVTGHRAVTTPSRPPLVAHSYTIRVPSCTAQAVMPRPGCPRDAPWAAPGLPQ